MFEIEVVKSDGADVLSDEVYAMEQCPSCGADVADAWAYCPACGGGLDGAGAVRTCSNISPDPEFFQCSECGRVYVPVQVMKGEGNAIEWACCPGCMAVLC